MRAAVGGGGQAQPQDAHVVLVDELAGQVHQRLQQRVAVDLQPQRRVDLVGADAAGRMRRRDAPQRGGAQVGAEHVLERPARLLRLHGMRAEAVDALAHRTHLVAHDAQEALAGGGVEVLVVEHLDGRLQVAERGAAAFGELLQQAVAQRLVGIVAGDVVEQQHEAVQRGGVGGPGRSGGGRGVAGSTGVGRRWRRIVRLVGALPACFGMRLGLRTGRFVRTRLGRAAGIAFASRDGPHRRQLHAQQLPAAAVRDELRRRRRHAALQPLLHALERMRDELPVEHRVDRAAEADQLGAAGQRRRVRQRPELPARALVVEQDAAVEVAHHHRLRQLRHQRGEPAALLLDVAAGLAHGLVHALAQRAALAQQLVDGVGQRARAGAALRRQRTYAVAGDRRLRLLGEPRRRDDEMPACAVHQHAGGERQQQPAGEQQRRPRREQRGERRPLGVVERQCEHAEAEQRQRRQRRARQQRGGGLARVEARPHAPPSSSSRTRAASSRVEKGLVT